MIYKKYVCCLDAVHIWLQIQIEVKIRSICVSLYASVLFYFSHQKYIIAHFIFTNVVARILWRLTTTIVILKACARALMTNRDSKMNEQNTNC